MKTLRYRPFMPCTVKIGLRAANSKRACQTCNSWGKMILWMKAMSANADETAKVTAMVTYLATCNGSKTVCRQRVWHTAVGLGAMVRNNTQGAVPYPYRPQALVSVWNVGDN